MFKLPVYDFSSKTEEVDEIRRTRPDYVFILPWNICDEIAEQMSFIREWGGKFVVPLPELEVF